MLGVGCWMFFVIRLQNLTICFNDFLNVFSLFIIDIELFKSPVPQYPGSIQNYYLYRNLKKVNVSYRMST